MQATPSFWKGFWRGASVTLVSMLPCGFFLYGVITSLFSQGISFLPAIALIAILALIGWIPLQERLD